MKTYTWKRALLAGAALLLTAALPLSAANVSVPLLELYTRGYDPGTGWGLYSTGEMEIQLDGGYKFGGNVLFGFSSSLLEVSSADILAFRAASVTMRELFGLPLDLTYFIGQGPTFGSGEVFADFFGAAPIGSSYTGFIHFPDAPTKARGTYDGLFTPTGTGLQFDFSPVRDRWLLSVLLYQDSLIEPLPWPAFGEGHYALDVRYALNLPKILFEGFLGATYPDASGNLGAYRAGVLFYTSPVKGVQILAEAGIPQWDPVADPFSLDLFYLLLEPRVQYKILSIVQTTLWRPAYYQQVPTGERAIDVNLDLQVGNVETLISGGIEGNLVYQTDPPPADEIVVKASPYVRLSTSGVVFETRLSTRVYPFDFGGDMFEVFLGVKAEF